MLDQAPVILASNCDYFRGFYVMGLTVNDKKEFARLLYSIGDEYTAAEEFVGDSSDTGQITKLAVELPTDPIVVKEMSKLAGDRDDITRIAGKYEVCSELWSIATNADIDAKDRITAIEKYSAIAGIYDSKMPVVNKVGHVPTVMRVTDHGSNDEWEDKLAKQQEALREQANAKLND